MLPPQEKVYLHFDNTGYFLKETMWFNAYVLDESNRPSEISRILYVELVAPEGGVVRTHKYKLQDGMCHGEFYLDSAYLSGFYEVRAYTRYMCNFGTDNYFSRVFPVYDIADGGNYTIRTILDRKREAFHEAEGERRATRRKRQQQTNADTILSRMQAVTEVVDNHYKRFVPQHILLCGGLPDSLSPCERVEMTFYATPNSTFSLSVTDGGTRMQTHYDKNIYKSLFQDRSWIERGFRAQSSPGMQQDVFFAPEKSLVVDGDVITLSRMRNRIRFRADAPVNFSMREDSVWTKGKVQTDSTGRWSFTLDDFYGDKKARVYAFLFDENLPSLRLHKWFSPPARDYEEDEIRFYDQELEYVENDTVSISEEEARLMPEVTVKGNRRRYYRKELKRSLVHYSYAEEREHLADHEPGAGDRTLYDPIVIATSVFQRYHYPIKASRWMVTKRYAGDDTIPEGHAHDRMGDDLSRYHIKEIVIRTDYATCLHYDYSTIGYPDKQHGSNLFGSLGWNHNPKNTNDYLRYVVCFIPYTEKEMKSVNLMEGGEITPLSRCTVVKGFTRSSSFPSPCYNDSVTVSDRDFRRTLYWNPEVHTDENGFAKIIFYNNSTCRSLHISAEGIGVDLNPMIYKE